MDGMKFRTEDELRTFFVDLKEHGIQLIDLTFYGTEDYHDKFAARKGVLLNPVRFSQKDYDILSGKVKKYLNTNRFKTEKEWLQNPEAFFTDKRMVALTLTPENIEQFEQMSFDETIAYLENLDDEYYRVIPDVETLMEMYGDADSDLFYSARDLYLNYQRRYIEEKHIEIYDVNDERQCFSRRY